MDNPMQAGATDIAWAAGFIDGEGSISVRRIWNAKLNRYMFQLYLRASQVDAAPLLKLQDIFGGRVGRCASRNEETDAPYFDWYLVSGKAAVAIQAMLPYLTLKRERGVIGIEFQSFIKRGRMLKGTEAAQLELQESYWKRMHDLNLRYAARRRAAAETKPGGLSLVGAEGCDSPVCIDDKDAEVGRNVRSLKVAEGGGSSA